MFQNITIDDDENINETNEERRKEKIQRLKELFSIRNCILYLLSFFISKTPIGNFTAPFGLAMFAAACSTGIPSGIIYVASAIGVIVGFGKSSLLSFIITSLIFLFAIIFFRPEIEDGTRNEKRKLGKHLFFSYLIVQFFGLFFVGMTFYKLLSCLAVSLIAYIFYKIFSNGMVFIKEYGPKTVFTIEEIMAASVIITIAVSSFGDLQLWGISIKNIICILMVLILGWKNGILVGGTAGITIGVLLGIIGGEKAGVIGAYAVSGMLAGLLNRFRKIRCNYWICAWKRIINICNYRLFSRNNTFKRNNSCFNSIIISTKKSRN